MASFLETGRSSALPTARWSWAPWRLLSRDDGDEVPLSLARRCCIGTMCTSLILYFIPMLSVIPLALFGGLQLPDPHARSYNSLSNSSANPVEVEYMSTGHSKTWYWDLQTAVCLVLFLPAALLAVAYQLKTRGADSTEKDLSELHEL
mmetsp:Transcript_53062/g.140004  ORF Transcript_53062/g.140004 Transcript_53062/m.140004 type:complete len:148 (-) Transcript_53062:71-514(-)